MTPWGQDPRSGAWFWEVSGKRKRSRLPPEYSPTHTTVWGTPKDIWAGEAKRDDENFCYVGAWEYKGDGVAPELSKEPLTFDNVHLATRSYK